MLVKLNMKEKRMRSPSQMKSKMKEGELSGSILPYIFIVLLSIAIPTLVNSWYLERVNLHEVDPSSTAYEETFGRLNLTAKNAVVVENLLGEILYEKNAREVVPLASLIKIATVFAYSQEIPVDTKVPISLEAVKNQGDTYLVDGSIFERDDILKHTLMSSSNDGIAALTQSYFATKGELLENKVKNLLSEQGLSDITFLNLNGLDIDEFTDGAIGSALSVAKLASEFYKNEEAIAETTTRLDTTFYDLTDRMLPTLNTNQDRRILTRALFSKTGYTVRAGGNLVVIMPYGENLYTLVVLGSSYGGRFTDMELLMQSTRSYLARRDFYMEKNIETRYTKPL